MKRKRGGLWDKAIWFILGLIAIGVTFRYGLLGLFATLLGGQVVRSAFQWWSAPEREGDATEWMPAVRLFWATSEALPKTYERRTEFELLVRDVYRARHFGEQWIAAEYGYPRTLVVKLLDFFANSDNPGGAGIGALLPPRRPTPLQGQV